MKNLLKLEELAQFLLCLAALMFLSVPGWVYPLLLLGPDIGMLGYLVGPRVGAFTYNLFHHKGLALLIILAGSVVMMDGNIWSETFREDIRLIVIGLILYGHASMDRMFGYGLKFGDSFQHTHLGWIGKNKSGE
ncbi:MAG TPA: DUF4260 domain-containing protein [Flavobacteriales bacterium]